VERYVAAVRRKYDLYGFIDIVALNGRETIGIQCTSEANASSRVHKIETECRETALAWLAAGNRILVIGWAKRDGRWVAREREVSELDGEPMVLAPLRRVTRKRSRQTTMKGV
jgi:hypothetical protein